MLYTLHPVVTVLFSFAFMQICTLREIWNPGAWLCATYEAACRRQKSKSVCVAKWSSALERVDGLVVLVLYLLWLKSLVITCSHNKSSCPFLLFFLDLLVLMDKPFPSELHRSWNKKESNNTLGRKTSYESCWKLYIPQLAENVQVFSVKIHIFLALFNIYLHPLNDFIRYYKKQKHVLNYHLIRYHEFTSNAFYDCEFLSHSGGQ